MWQRMLLLLLAAPVVLTAGMLPAQEACSSSSSLWVRTEWLRLEVIGGRLAVQSSRCGQSRVCVEPAEGAGTRQTLSIQAQPTAVVVSYTWENGQRQISLEVCERQHLTITRQSLDGAHPSQVRYRQPATGLVTLEIGENEPTKYAAASLWHLLLTEPVDCRQQLVSLLAELRPHWRLAEQAELIEGALLAQSGADVRACRQEWQVLVDALASESFATRQAADLALRQAGQPVLAFLRQQNPAELDPEQKRRIRGIISELADGSPDSPERVAGWLLDDKTVWLALLGRGDLDQRTSAAEHLAKLCRRDLPFDPSGSLESRQAQLGVLREKLVR